MYKTAVYTLVNGVITHQKQQISVRQFHVGFRLFGTKRVRVRVRARFMGRFRRQQIIDR